MVLIANSKRRSPRETGDRYTASYITTFLRFLALDALERSPRAGPGLLGDGEIMETEFGKVT